MLSRRPAILIAEDYPDFRAKIVALLEPLSLTSHAVRNGRLAVEFIRDTAKPLDLVITDMDMPVNTGWDVIDAVHVHRPLLPVIMQTGEAGYNYVRKRAESLGICIIDKQDVPTRLLPEVCTALGISYQALV